MVAGTEVQHRLARRKVPGRVSSHLTLISTLGRLLHLQKMVKEEVSACCFPPSLQTTPSGAGNGEKRKVCQKAGLERVRGGGRESEREMAAGHLSLKLEYYLKF